MILSDTIIKRLEKESGKSLYPHYDVRYLGKWVEEYPQCFPKYVVSGNFEVKVVWTTSGEYRYEIHKKP
jgi:hypothetical protein